MILMNDFKAESKSLKDSILKVTQKIIESGWYVLGEEVKQFENQWAKSCGVSHAVGVGNGMDAIEIALRALEIGPGDEVITTPMSAFATVLAIYRSGATPVLADIDPETALLSLESVKRCIGKKTKAVLLVHLYGQLLNVSSWKEFCDNEGVYLIEDCAQSHLAKIKGQYAGSFGEAGAYSFYPTKNLSTLGDAGMLVTNNDIISLKASRLRNYGQSIKYHHTELGLNSRLDEIHAAILIEKLKWLTKYTERRKTIAQAYHQGISNLAVQLLKPPISKDSHVYHLFVVTCSKREALQKHLLKNDIQTLMHYPVPIHHQKPCISISHDPNGLSVSEQHAKNCLSLPCHPQMTDEDVQIVIDAVNSF